MKILIDTNILISAFVFYGQIGKLLDSMLDNDEIEIYVTEYVDAEFRRVVNETFSKKSEKALEKYKKANFKIYPSTQKILGKVRDKKDIPVLSDAIYYGADILLTGDKDFFETEIDMPIIISPAVLAEYLQQKFGA